MRTALVLATCLAASACGAKHNGESVCNQIPPPAACMQACDPSPGAADTCPAGYHCSPDGTCDAVCTPNGGECGDGYTCTSDGRCESTGPGGVDAGIDMACPDVHFTPTKTTPSIELVLDRSGSMSTTDIAPDRYDALHTGLTGAMGAITTSQANAYFGAFLFSGDECPLATAFPNFSVPRALNNASAIDTLIGANGPGGNTPTADAIDVAVADFAAHPPPMGSPPIILLATDGEPNSCNDATTNPGPSITAVQNAYTAGIRTFIIGLAGLNTQYLQNIANAGTGVMTNQPPGCANCSPYYTANDPASLVAGFNAIINGVLSCDLAINGQVDPATACNGTVTLNGQQLMCGTDWQVDPNGMVIHLLGSACNTLKTSSNPTVDATFPCGSVIF